MLPSRQVLDRVLLIPAPPPPTPLHLRELAGGSPVPLTLCSGLIAFHNLFAPHLPSSSAVCLSCCGADHSLPDAPLDPAGGPRWPVFLQILPRQVEGWRGAVFGFKLWCLSSPFRLTSTFSSLGCRQAQGKGLIVQLALCVHRCRTCGCGWGRATLLHCCM